MAGTIYGLVDPRDDETRYIGQTVRPLATRLTGHLGKGKTSPRVRAWIAELRAAGLKPRIVAVREGVPADELLAAESEEITRILAAGGTLLNEQATALGRELNRRRREAEGTAAERAAWRELADVALDVLGGPLPPGELPEVEIPEVSWAFMSKVGPDHRESMKSLITSDYPLWAILCREQEEAARLLWWYVRGAWGSACGKGGDRFSDHMKLNVSVAAETPCTSRAEASRYLSLTVWYMVAMHPWRHLAELAGLASDGDFIAWAGRDAGVREALEFLAGRRDGALERLPYRWYSQWEKGPGHQLGAVAAAYSGTAPEAVRSHLAEVLGKTADDHMLTGPMADLLVRLDPGALDSVFGRDIAADLDHDLGLADGASGRVLRALVERIGHVNDPAVRRAADRSAQTLPVVALPDYPAWSGPGLLAAQVISASLVRAGLAEPSHATAEGYLAEVMTLWTPRLDNRRQQAA